MNTPSENIFSQFFEPASVAVVGSFREGVFGGYVVIKSLQEAGFEGDIYPVNPGYQEVRGLRVFPSVAEIEGDVDVALVMINARRVAQIVRQCGEKGIRAVILVADGFAERDAAGRRLQEEVLALAREYGVRLIGPNTAGILNTANGFNPCPYEAGYYQICQGGIAVCSQTGMINPQAVPYVDQGLGISKICDFGNKCDVEETELLEYLVEDPGTRVISMYVEAIPAGVRFLETARRVVRKKPLLVLKAGTTPAGARAAASHTGSLAVDDRMFDAVCRQAGILRLRTFNELFELPKIFSLQPLPGGSRMGIVSYTGGVGVLAADTCPPYGLEIAKLGEPAARILENMFEGLGKVPVDIGPMIPTIKDFSEVYTDILEAVLGDDGVDCLFNVIWMDARGRNEKAYRQTYETLREHLDKPIATWIYGPSMAAISAMKQDLESMGFPVFATPEACVRALGLAYQYAASRNR